jgi:hypothetical protein
VGSITLASVKHYLPLPLPLPLHLLPKHSLIIPSFLSFLFLNSACGDAVIPHLQPLLTALHRSVRDDDAAVRARVASVAAVIAVSTATLAM